MEGKQPDSNRTVKETKDGLSENFTKWTIRENGKYFPAFDGIFTPKLPPALYKIGIDDRLGTFFQKSDFISDDIIKLPIKEIDDILNDISTFWSRKDKFKEYGFINKRGILLMGPAGNGKTCAIQLIIRELIQGQQGSVFRITNIRELDLYSIAIHTIFKQIEPDTQIVIILEDIDSLISNNPEGESNLLNLLDGIDSMANIVYVATTNYPELLKERILNRPSRFDRRYTLHQPNKEVRKYYIEHFSKPNDLKDINIDKWVKETEGLSLAHLRELIISVFILGNTYEETLTILKSYSERPSSHQFKFNGDNGKIKIGFASEEKSNSSW